MSLSKDFRWVRNPNVDGYTDEHGEFVPMEISALDLWSKTKPSTISADREQSALRYLNNNIDVYMPVLVWQPTGEAEEDPGNDLTYLDGRHTLDAIARNFDDVTMTVLVPQEQHRKIAELLEVSTSD